MPVTSMWIASAIMAGNPTAMVNSIPFVLTLVNVTPMPALITPAMFTLPALAMTDHISVTVISVGNLKMTVNIIQYVLTSMNVLPTRELTMLAMKMPLALTLKAHTNNTAITVIKTMVMTTLVM